MLQNPTTVSLAIRLSIGSHIAQNADMLPEAEEATEHNAGQWLDKLYLCFILIYLTAFVKSRKKKYLRTN